MNESEGGGQTAPPTPPSPEPFCNALDEWAELMAAAHPKDGFAEQWRSVRLAIRKSCLLDRVLYGGEKPSKTPCPVHKGRWSGCHLGWPGAMWSDGTLVKEDPMLRGWYDEGCRCFMHGCGCTTGWQPDAACGCALDAEPADEAGAGSPGRRATP